MGGAHLNYCHDANVPGMALVVVEQKQLQPEVFVSDC